jgi:hypothetical protein
MENRLSIEFRGYRFFCTVSLGWILTRSMNPLQSVFAFSGFRHQPSTVPLTQVAGRVCQAGHSTLVTSSPYRVSFCDTRVSCSRHYHLLHEQVYMTAKSNYLKTSIEYSYSPSRSGDVYKYMFRFVCNCTSARLIPWTRRGGRLVKELDRQQERGTLGFIIVVRLHYRGLVQERGSPSITHAGRSFPAHGDDLLSRARLPHTHYSPAG